MAKCILKFALTVLLTLLLVVIPLLGIPQAGFSGLLTDDDINVSNELKEGQMVRFSLSVSKDAEEAVLKNNAAKTAEVLRKRLTVLGYNDSDVAVISNREVAVTLPFNADTSIIRDKLNITGNFVFKDTNQNTIISSADIEKCTAYYSTSYASTGAASVNYYLAFHLTEEGMKKYTEGTTKIAASSDKYIQLYVDGTTLSRLSVDAAVTENDFSFGPFDYEDALWYSNLINAGPLPQSVTSSAVTVQPSLGQGAFGRLFIAACAAAVILAAVLIFFFRLSGAAATLSAISAVGIALILNTAFGLGVSLSGIASLCFTVILTVLLHAGLLNAAKKETSSDAYTCLKAAMRKNLWFIIDVLLLPFVISLAMMMYANVYTMIFAELIFVGVMASGVSLLLTTLSVSALSDAGSKKSAAFGN